MPGTFTFDAANNRVTVTGGTSGSPARFADFVTADRAGSRTLRAAIAPALGLTLTTQIKPCEKLALLITFVLAGTNAGAGDTIDIVGTDAWGGALIESIDVSGGNGTYVSTKRFRTITSFSCTGFSDGVGTVTVTQPQWGVIWDNGNGQYKISCKITFGDYSTSTYFADSNKQIFIMSGVGISYNGNLWVRTSNATIQLGVLIDASTKATKEGCQIIIDTQDNPCYLINDDTASSGYTYFYSLSIANLGGNEVCLTVSYGRVWNLLATRNTPLAYGGVNVDFYNLTLQGMVPNYAIFRFVAALDRVVIQGGTYAALECLSTDGSSTLKGAVVQNFSVIALFINAVNDHYCIDVETTSWGIGWWGTSTGRLYRQYSFNCHVSDKSGNNISGATVTLLDKDNNQVFSTTTGANGKIALQTVSRGYYDQDHDQTLQDYGPHTLTIIKTGYVDFQDTITLDRKMDLEVGIMAVDSIWDDTYVEGTLTPRQAMRLCLSALAGKSSGMGTASVLVRDTGDTKNRLTVTVDANGNRTAVTKDAT